MELQSVRDQLFFSGFSSEVKPLSSERTGSESTTTCRTQQWRSCCGFLKQSPTCRLETLRSVDVGVSPRCFHQYFTNHSQYHSTDPGSVLPSRICGYQVNFMFRFFSPTKLVHFLTGLITMVTYDERLTCSRLSWRSTRIKAPPTDHSDSPLLCGAHSP